MKKQIIFILGFLLFGLTACTLFSFRKNVFDSVEKKEKTKTLILLRHAKSSHNDTSIPDFSRPLDTSGIAEANEMGLLLKNKIKSVDLIVASPAKRTHQTAEIICTYLNYPKENIVWDSLLYLCTKETMIDQIRQTDEKVRTVIFIGHNPSMTNTANFLQNDLKIDEVKTCGTIAIDYQNLMWTEVGKTKGKLIFYEKPKN